MCEITENTRFVTYNLKEEGSLYFIPRCDCGRFVKMDGSVIWGEYKGLSDKPNATCKHCGRVRIHSIGIF